MSVIPLTKLSGKTRNVYSFEVVIEPGLAGNAERSIIMPYQIRTIARARLVTRLGRLRDPAIRRAVEDRLLDHIGIEVDTA